MQDSGVRIVIADDHELVREGLVAIVAHDPGIEVAATCGTAEALLDLLEADDAFDVVVMDLVMPGRGGFEALGEIVQRWPDVGVLVISAHQRAELAVRCVRAGARGFLSKDLPGELFLDSIHRVADGEVVVDPEFLTEVLASLAGARNDGRPHEQLSARELEVFLRIAGGESITRIAQDLSLSPKTVSTYRRRVLAKLDRANNAQLTAYALEHRLLELAAL